MTDALKTHCAAIRSTVFSHGFLPHWIERQGARIRLTLPFAAAQAARELIAADPVLNGDDWQIAQVIEPLTSTAGDGRPPAARQVIAVASGKGGVGKSSVTVSLALALAAQGVRVGILDADIYGPSLPIMLGNQDARLTFTPNRKMLPLQRFGLQVNSLGYLVDKADATIWRGPMASGALQQLYSDTQWQDLDYLLIDLPPGTGDIQLTLAQKLPLSGAIIVTTPQTVAVQDAQKGIAMLRKVGVPVVGLIENMSAYQCSECGHLDAVFGHNGGAEAAQANSVPLLGQWPLLGALRESLDNGEPLVYAQPQHSYSQMIIRDAQALAATLYELVGEGEK